MNEWKFPLKKNAKRAFAVRPLEAAAFDAQFQLPDARQTHGDFAIDGINVGKCGWIGWKIGFCSQNLYNLWVSMFFLSF